MNYRQFSGDDAIRRPRMRRKGEKNSSVSTINIEKNYRPKERERKGTKKGESIEERRIKEKGGGGGGVSRVSERRQNDTRAGPRKGPPHTPAVL